MTRPYIYPTCARHLRALVSNQRLAATAKMPLLTQRRYSSKPSAGIMNLAKRIPKGTWDTHMHVTDPANFPLAKDAAYTPSTHTITDAQNFLTTGLGISKMVIVQPSIYGNDNSCTLNGLKQLGPQNGRAVIQFDPSTVSRAQMQEWHNLGVRGVRLNFRSVGTKPEGTSLGALMHQYADIVRPFGWVLELYIAMDDLEILEPIVPDLGGVKICIDHFGHPHAASLATAQSIEVLPGFTSLANLLQLQIVWVKVSAAYRLDSDPAHPPVQSLARWILRTRPDRCVFATDWPHTRFEGVDVAVYLEKLLDWCEAEHVSLKQVLVENAEELFDARS